MSIYFTSDTHFYHTNIIKYVSRPFNSTEAMNETMISNWNKKVRVNDNIYILGDFAFCNGKMVNELLRRLNGKKYLIKGNHDTFLKYKDFDTSLFQWIKDYYKLVINKTKIILFHYPIQTWDCKHHGSIHLFGHVHNTILNNSNNLMQLTKSYNVGADVNNFMPVGLNEILEKFKD